nr:ribonuclease H-like domain-containing protein [Tanacetum cinerariifolium]
MAFLSSSSSINKVDTTSIQVSAANIPVSTVSSPNNTTNLSDATLALLSIRARRYFKRTGKKITINGSDTAGYDNTKVECFNSHKMVHFARECRSPRSQESRPRNQDNSRKTVIVEDTSSKAMVTLDGSGFDWSYMGEDEVPTNMALIDFSDSEETSPFSQTMENMMEDLLLLQAVLKEVSRKNNMYSFDLKNVVPSKGLTCLFAKATNDESNLWHRRLGHINFKTMNKIKKGNPVRGLLSNIFENDHTCVACQKKKQHKASCGFLAYSVLLVLRTPGLSAAFTNLIIGLDMILFDDSPGSETETLLLWRSLKLLLDASILVGKCTSSGIFITSSRNDLEHFIPNNSETEFKNYEMNQFYGIKGIKREFSNARTPQQNGVAERKNRTLIEAARTITKKVEEKLHVNFLKNKPNVTGSGPGWLFDIDSLTNSMNYQPTSNTLHNAIMEAGGKDRPPMLAPGNYVQWNYRIKRYIDTKPNHELIHYCLKNPPYKFTWADKEVPISEGGSVTTTETYMENYKNVSPDIHDQLNAEAKAVQIILTGIDNDIYSIVDACSNACEMWKAIKRLKQGESIHVQDLETNLYWEFGKFTSRDGESLESYYSRFYKMINELVRNQCDVTNHQVNVQFLLQLQQEWKRIGNVAGAREIVGITVVQKSGIQCYNCKEFGHVARECQKPKRAKDAAYHKEKMLLCKQEEARIQLNADQADWRDDTDDESKDQQLEAHYMYMAQIQEVSPDAADSRPIFDSKPVQKNDDDDDLAYEHELLASLIEKLKCKIDDSKNRNKFLETSNKVLVEQLKGEIDDFKTQNKSLESSKNRFKEANNKLSETNKLMYIDVKKFKVELDRRNDVEYASKVEINCAKAKGDLISYKMESQKSFNKYTQQINDLNKTILEMKKKLSAHQKTISILSQAKEAQIKLYKTREDKELDKVITLENKVKVLVNIVYKTSQSVQTMNMLNSKCKMSFAKPEFLKKA